VGAACEALHSAELIRRAEVRYSRTPEAQAVKHERRRLTDYAKATGGAIHRDASKSLDKLGRRTTIHVPLATISRLYVCKTIGQQVGLSASRVDKLWKEYRALLKRLDADLEATRDGPPRLTRLIMTRGR
jgi:hypothetical protein